GATSSSGASPCTAACARTRWRGWARLATRNTASSTRSSWGWWSRASWAGHASAQELLEELLDRVAPALGDAGGGHANGLTRAGHARLHLGAALGERDRGVHPPVGERVGAGHVSGEPLALIEQVVGGDHAVADPVGGGDGLEVERLRGRDPRLPLDQRGDHARNRHHVAKEAQ